MQFPNDSFSMIWFNITVFVYEIAIPNAPLESLLSTVIGVAQGFALGDVKL
jgi:hypothetical protein